MNKLIAYFVKHRLVGDLLTVFILVVGVAATLLIRRDVFPNVTFDVISITTLFPSASSEEVEKLLTSPIEQDLQEVDGIKKLRSTSVEGRSYIVAQLDPDQTTEAKGKSDIQDVVDRFELPEGAKQPIVTSLESKQTPIIEVSLAGDLPQLELRQIAKDLERELEKISGVARVIHTGLRDREIRVETDPRKLSQYRLAIDDVVNALKGQNVSISAGSIEPLSSNAKQPERIVRTIGEFKNLDDVRNTVIRANDIAASIKVRDVAKVYYDLEKAEIANRTNGTPSLSLVVLKKERADAITVVDAIRARMAELKPMLGEKVKVSFINDFSTFIRNRVSVLTGNLIVGLVLVLMMLTLILEKRVALLVSIGIPFSFLGTMIIFYMYGYSINLISLLGLIIVSGMLVDDAIVVTDNAVRLTEEGMDPHEAAIKATQQIWPAVTASVMTTIIAFLPMMFMSGIFGKFVREIPLGVIIALLISMFEAFFILPQHYANFVAKAVTRAKNGGGPKRTSRAGRTLDFIGSFWDKSVVPRYVKYLRISLKHRYLTIGALVVLFIGTLGLAAKGMRFILFPPEGVEIFFVRLEAPTGVSLEAMGDLVEPVEKIVATLPDHELDDFVTNIGIHQEEPNDPNTKRGAHYAQIAVYLSPETERIRTAAEIIEDLRQKTGKPPGFTRVTFQRVSGGPPVGKPVSVGVRARTYEEILPAAEALKAELAKVRGVSDISDSYIRGKEEVQIKVNRSEAAAAGLSAAAIGTTVRGAFDGIVATTIQELDDEVDVRVLFPPTYRSQGATLEEILIPNRSGNLVPLTRVATIAKGQGIASYDHEANQREVRVTSEVDTNITSATQANADLQARLPEIQKRFPKITFAFGGEEEDTQESMASLVRAFIVAFFGIFMILILTFGNLLQPMLVVLTIPMGMIAVVWTLFLHGQPLSFMSMLGVIALAGVIVNNAIIFVDFVNQRRAEGADRWKSIEDSASMRIRPIFLTTMTTVAGLLPTAYGIGGLDRFVMPIALALGWGLFFGSMMTAFLFPSAIAILDDVGEWSKKWRGRVLKRRQEAMN